MCLYIRPGYRIKTAKENITCYKVMRREMDENDNYVYYSAFMYKEAFLNSRMAILENIKPRVEKFGYLINGKWMRRVGYGYYHVFKNMEDAMKLTDDFNRYHHSGDDVYVIVGAVIPKGTKYYEGFDGNGKDGFATRMIDYLDEIKC